MRRISTAASVVEQCKNFRLVIYKDRLSLTQLKNLFIVRYTVKRWAMHDDIDTL